MTRPTEPTKGPGEVPHFAWPARFDYTYRWPFLDWLLEGHAVLREALLRAFPKALRRDLVITERIAEIPFALRALRLPPGSWVVDIGSQWSPLPLHMATLGLRTVAVDVVKFPVAGHGVDFVQADMRRPPFKGGRLDALVMVSTLEHVGLGYYDPRRGREDDVALMRGLRDLLKPDGFLVLTVPYGRPAEDHHQRVYDRPRLARIMEGWSLQEARYFARREGGWRETEEAEAALAESVPETRAVAMLRLRRA
ncbi:MAG TPA: DUF268 domain-containing protein [Thermoplasmata archaeon]|jgi:SAM-dependent methyltransferase